MTEEERKKKEKKHTEKSHNFLKQKSKTTLITSH